MVSSEHKLTDSILQSHIDIISADAQSVELDLIEPMTLSFGTFPSRPSGWLKLACQINGQSMEGFGEGATLPRPLFTDDSGENIAEHMQMLSLAITKNNDPTLEQALQILSNYQFSDGGRYPTAKLATEMALLDASLKANNISAKEFVGIDPTITEVPYGKSIGGASTEAMLRQVEAALDLNAKKIKLKIAPQIFHKVIDAINAVRQEHPTMDIMVDANGGFDPTDKSHLDMLRQLDNEGLVTIEEPVSRIGTVRGLDAVRMLRRTIKFTTPICLDDCLQNADDCQRAITENLAEIINIKPGRVGSFMKSLELANFAADQKAEVMVGGMLEGTPGRSMTTVLGGYCLQLGFSIPGDLSLAQERLASDLVSPQQQLQLSPNGGIILPDGPGWGF